MKLIYISLTLLSVASAARLGADTVKPDVPPVAQRTAVLNRANALLTRHKALTDDIGAGVKNPFNPLAVDVVEAPTRSRLPGSAKELIAVLAGQISPTGSAERDGERYLLFGQRKVKVGEGIPITFENTQFELEVVSIEGGAFTVRLNHEEFTRPIKTAKTP